MANELGVDKRLISLAVERKLHAAIVERWWQPEDGFDSSGEKKYTKAYRRALEEKSAGFHLPYEAYQKIENDMKAAYEARMKKRKSKRSLK